MLEFYHHGSSVCAAKVRFAMAEKGVVPDEMHYIDILKGEQSHPAVGETSESSEAGPWDE